MASLPKSTGRSSIGMKAVREPVHKKTSIGMRNSSLSTSMMNKSKRKNYKKYRGQGTT